MDINIDIEQFKDFLDEEKTLILQDVLVEFLTRDLLPSEEQNVLNMIDHCAPYQVCGATLVLMQRGVFKKELLITNIIGIKLSNLAVGVYKILNEFEKVMEAATEDPLEFDQDFEYKMTSAYLRPFVENVLLKLKKHNSDSSKNA